MYVSGEARAHSNDASAFGISVANPAARYAIVLILGYIFYGGWLAKRRGAKPDRPIPATEMEAA